MPFLVFEEKTFGGPKEEEERLLILSVTLVRIMLL